MTVAEATAHETDTRDLVEELKKRVTGDVRFDATSRLLYSTDASIYQIVPLGVVIPKTTDDVLAVIETANKHNVPVLPRGGGTSLAGQTVGRAVVIDFSKHLRNVIEVNPEEQWVRAQPGIILDELNRHLVPHNLLFTPDPSTSNRGNIGGAIGNNSCGSHSIIWGKTSDNVHELSVILSDGTRTKFAPLKPAEFLKKTELEGLEGHIYRELMDIGRTERDEVAARFPKIMRRVGGYNLDILAKAFNPVRGEPVEPRQEFDMASFAVGAEGTLFTLTEAKLKLVRRPKMRAVAVVHFNGLIEAMEATVATLELNPSAVEHIGSMILNNARDNLEYSRLLDFVQGTPSDVLAVEFIGDTESELGAQLDALEARMQRGRLGYATTRLMKPADQARVWAVRKAGLGLMMNVKGDAKPIPFVEDTAVAPEVLPRFVERFDEIIRAHHTEAGYYGHASVGCLHIRPLINLKNDEGVGRMVHIMRDVSNLVLEFGGSLSAEHGDGLVRGPWNEKMFGTRLYEAFRRVKKAFDPNGIMNPGKIVDSPPMTENLRINPRYRTADVHTGFSFEREGGFAAAIEQCNGQGACRKTHVGTMCPSFMATRDEEHSPRGRANALRSAISGALPLNSLTSKRTHDVLDLCLECKACKAECPSNVDMAKLKYEFLDRYYKANGRPLQKRIMGNIAAVSRLGSFFAPLSNWMLGSKVIGEIMEQYVGIDRRRKLPAFASQTFYQWLRARANNTSRNDKTPVETRGQVLLFNDTFTNYNHPELGRAAVELLEALGYEVVVPPWKCCGRPMLSSGMIDKAKKSADANIALAQPYLDRGAKIVGLEPSCLTMFKDDYSDLAGHQKTSSGQHSGQLQNSLLASKSLLIEEFLAQEKATLGNIPFKSAPSKILFHGHCHQKALVGTRPALDVLRSLPETEVIEIDAGCCGMAGSFGYEKSHYDVSMPIAEDRLFPAIRSHEDDAVVVTEGVSCRQQIEHGTGRRAKHLVEVLADALKPKPSS
ncbi:MAG: anaerobic glycerol-3-phosphate dehydrogenase subunit C [Chloroflexi bacterium]|nr:anaerobic glycerol-3-phosphate dehydrogenase subunit C [Chloroflexota bacterium]